MIKILFKKFYFERGKQLKEINFVVEKGPLKCIQKTFGIIFPNVPFGAPIYSPNKFHLNQVHAYIGLEDLSRHEKMKESLLQ